ncbi:transporter substrate-binding domain-containing protein [Shewanella colwelliana]|uniref:transporter substrate-binding domain-containing protein n=1 Tax=Shewanella colwelliana TaxID=23 RepID=UPI0022AEA59F|nr:transporter substrate-binding domain-containing protein [Shewanella colwelliana]MCZ4338879.1 transporter substrate-binding domain-containing protein [Shewanella colwelliana]
MKFFWFAILLLCCSAWASTSDGERQDIALYTYHYMPPYVINPAKEVGLFYDIARFFNQHQQTYRFKVSYIPRKRLNYQLSLNEFEGMVIGVNPIWFKDLNQSTYLWSAPFMQDQDEIISHLSNPVEFKTPQALYDKRVGGITGFRYHTIDQLVADGFVTRINTANESQLIKMLLKNRFDCAIVSRATTIYYQHILNTNQALYFSSVPHDQYTRHILVPKRLSAEFNAIIPLIEQLISNYQWQQKMQQYDTGLPAKSKDESR